jgi:hypothetical protein
MGSILHNCRKAVAMIQVRLVESEFPRWTVLRNYMHLNVLQNPDFLDALAIGVLLSPQY